MPPQIPIRNSLLSKYGSSISNLSTLLRIDDNGNILMQSIGYYEAKNLYPVEYTSNYLVRETKAPDGYVLDSKWSWEIKVLAPATSYSGSLQRVNFGEIGTYQGKSGSAATTVENTPEPITHRLQKTDATYTGSATAVHYGTTASCKAASFTAEGTITADGYAWVYYMAFKLFYIFKSYAYIGYVKLVNVIAKTTLGIYILHDNLLIRGNGTGTSLLWDQIFNMGKWYQSSFFVITSTKTQVWKWYIDIYLSNCYNFFRIDCQCMADSRKF